MIARRCVEMTAPFEALPARREANVKQPCFAGSDAVQFCATAQKKRIKAVVTAEIEL